jgi:hypothetical protein
MTEAKRQSMGFYERLPERSTCARRFHAVFGTEPSLLRMPLTEFRQRRRVQTHRRDGRQPQRRSVGYGRGTDGLYLTGGGQESRLSSFHPLVGLVVEFGWKLLKRLVEQLECRPIILPCFGG